MHPSGPTEVGVNLLTIGYLVVIVVAFYFLLIRPQQKRQKETQELLSTLRPGDRVVTAGGLFGTIERMEDDIMELRIADGVVVDMAVSSVVRRADVVEPGADDSGESAERPHLESDEVEEPPVRVSAEDEKESETAASAAEKKDE
jgi:preprotein translocase subunit YajC